MKKSLLALAVLGAYAGVASAQSSVTLFGTVDMAGTYVKNDTPAGGDGNRWALTTNGINSSQLGFRGIEDLGGGLKAGFYLLADLAAADTGNAAAKFWGRRSTVSLYTNAGELRLGRDYTPTFWNLTIFDAFGTNGVGSSLNPRQLYEGTRSDNSIGYFLPGNIGGFYGQVMAAAPEGGTTADRAGRYLGGRIGFAAGPFDVAGSYGEVDNVTAFTAGTTGSGPVIAVTGSPKLKVWNIGGAWNFGFAKLMGYYDRTDVSCGHGRFLLDQCRDPVRPERGARRLRPQQVELHPVALCRARWWRRLPEHRQLDRPVEGDVPVQPVQADGDVRNRCAGSTTRTRRDGPSSAAAASAAVRPLVASRRATRLGIRHFF